MQYLNKLQDRITIFSRITPILMVVTGEKEKDQVTKPLQLKHIFDEKYRFPYWISLVKVPWKTLH